MARVTAENLLSALKENVDPSARVMTDDVNSYDGVGKHFACHETVNHTKKEYVRGDVTKNTIEGFFGLFKRGINGIYHHVGRKHLHRYTSEYEFRCNARDMSDGDRTELAIAASKASG